MTLSTMLPVAMVALFAIALFGFLKLRKSPPNPKVRRYLQLFGVVCAVGSMVAIGASFYFSRDIAQLCTSWHFQVAFSLLLLVQMKARKGKAVV
jgi:hypothetical protein